MAIDAFEIWRSIAHLDKDFLEKRLMMREILHENSYRKENGAVFGGMYEDV